MTAYQAAARWLPHEILGAVFGGLCMIAGSVGMAVLS